MGANLRRALDEFLDASLSTRILHSSPRWSRAFIVQPGQRIHLDGPIEQG